jgi:hypothetical protein
LPDINEYASYVSSYMPVRWIGQTPWRAWRRLLEPICMPHMTPPTEQPAVRNAMRGSSALLARWNEEWDTAPCDWWWVCCDDRDYDVERLPSRARRDVRAGLRKCQVRRIEIDWFAVNGYEMHSAACARYGDGVIESPSHFEQHVRRFAGYSGHELWGAFVGEQLAAYAVCVVLQDAVNMSALKAHPAHLKACPNNALVYHITSHYLRERNVGYVTDGSRVLHHETSFQDFLSRMGYRRVYCPLKTVFSPAAKLVLASGVDRWGRRLGLHKLAPGVLSGAAAARALDVIARQCADPDRLRALAAEAAAGGGETVQPTGDEQPS